MEGSAHVISQKGWKVPHWPDKCLGNESQVGEQGQICLSVGGGSGLGRRLVWAVGEKRCAPGRRGPGAHLESRGASCL